MSCQRFRGRTLSLSSKDQPTARRRFFAWKTRALDTGEISALAGLQKPAGDPPSARAWFIENVANSDVKTLNEVKRLTSLIEGRRKETSRSLASNARPSSTSPPNLTLSEGLYTTRKSACTPSLGLTYVKEMVERSETADTSLTR